MIWAVFWYVGQDEESGAHLWERIDTDLNSPPSFVKPMYRHYDPCEMTAVYNKVIKEE